MWEHGNWIPGKMYSNERDLLSFYSEASTCLLKIVQHWQKYLQNECLAISLKTVLKDGVFIMICFLFVSSESLRSCAVTGFFFFMKIL